mgnify:CR=1 FL=1|tara:strand:- start:132 stop:341 length:210 start_codon:yes stop_codon:yes gene_type:complete
MALEDLQSNYGPSNKKGEKGTGTGVDTLANELTKGLEELQSKYGGSEKLGTKPTGPDPLGNIPAERSFE